MPNKPTEIGSGVLINPSTYPPVTALIAGVSENVSVTCIGLFPYKLAVPVTEKLSAPVASPRKNGVSEINSVIV